MNAGNPDLTGEGLPSPRSNLTRLLTPWRAETGTTELGWTLQLEPMPVAMALEALAAVRNGPATEVLLSAGGSAPATTSALAGLSEHIELRALDGHLVISDDRLDVFTADEIPDDLEAVLVDGPIEASDVAAFVNARSMSRSSLTADLRAETSLRIERNRTITVDARDADVILHFVSEKLRSYVASIRGTAGETVAAPELGLIHRILDRTGRILVRPVETEVYSTAIDIGIVTDEQSVGPADTSFIYDVFGNSWHGE